MPTQLDRREPCHNRVLAEDKHKLIFENTIFSLRSLSIIMQANMKKYHKYSTSSEAVMVVYTNITRSRLCITCCVTVRGSCCSPLLCPPRTCQGQSCCSQNGWGHVWTQDTFLLPSHGKEKNYILFQIKIHRV